jgi:dTDP-glucose 4,6-dehydratase
MKRVMVTGIGGAIGAHTLAHIMHNTDWEVIGIDSFNHKGYFDRLVEITTDHQDWLPRLHIHRHDLTAPFTKRQMDKFGKIDYIINLASLSDVQASIDDPVTFIRNNTELMLTMLEYARVCPVEAFIQFSTDEVYGPASIDQAHPEWDTILPSNPYSASKVAQEAIAIAYWRSYGIPVIITNTMNNFGEMQSPSKFPAMIQKHIAANEKIQVHTASDGQVGTRFYIHSRNVADAVLFILEKTKPVVHQPGHVDRPERYNIVGDLQVNNRVLVGLISKMMGKKALMEEVNFHDSNPGHDLHYGLTGDKLKNLGWKSPVRFAESLSNTIDWQKDHPEWLK